MKAACSSLSANLLSQVSARTAAASTNARLIRQFDARGRRAIALAAAGAAASPSPSVRFEAAHAGLGGQLALQPQIYTSSDLFWAGSVSYNNESTNFVFVNDDVRMVIKRISEDTMSLSFVNRKDEKVPLPADTEVRNLMTNVKIPEYPKNEFIVTWFSNVVVRVKNKDVLHLLNQRQQAMFLSKRP
eukprot:tig00001057_g6689.t1